MKIDLDSPIITLEVMLTGKKRRLSVEAALDTGSTYNVIPWGVGKEVGLCP